jgi:2-oxoglutarate dehydrogenase E2 component (dihydrolipoamide succinyltransferase)
MSTNIVVPELGESIVEATVVRWLKKEGEPVMIGEAVVELETEKANFEVASEQSGVLVRIARGADEDVKVGDLLGVIEATEKGITPTKIKLKEEKIEPPTKEVKPQKVLEAENEKTEIKLVTPVAKQMAEELKIDTSKIIGTGPGNRVTKEDIQKYINNERVEAREPATESLIKQKIDKVPTVTPAVERDRREERIRMSARRRTIARRMLDAQRTAAILTTINEVDMSAVMDLRKRHRDTFKERYGIGIGIVSFFIKASIGALKEFPLLNAEIQEDEIVLKRYYDIGVAIGATGGLVVPVLRDADKMSYADIERAISELSKKSEEGTLTLEDLRGGTFTISNGGVYGSLLSTPILNPPQVAILGLHKIEERPIVLNHEIVIKPMMYLALSYDHRIVDGREAVLFLVRIKKLIEDPGALLLEG